MPFTVSKPTSNSVPMRFGLIADDLSGACDAALGFARAGYSAGVSFNAIPEFLETQMLAVDTDSRTLAPELAHERVLRAAIALRDAPLLFKKLDSTLRGHIALELQAALEGSERRKLIFAPAFPTFARTTSNGVHLLEGVPIHQTAFANDPRNPVLTSHLPTLLSNLGDVRVVSLEELHRNKLADILETYDRLVIDIAEESDLLSLIAQVSDRRDVLWAGSTGLAYALGQSLVREHVRAKPIMRYERILTVIGSVNLITRTQLEATRDCENVVQVQLGQVELGNSSLERSRTALRNGSSVMLFSSPPTAAADDAQAALVVAQLADHVAQLEGDFDALVLTGGDTAIHVAKRLGALGVRLERELEMGVPFGCLIGSKPYPVVTKAGGFGTPKTLVNILQLLRGSS